MQQNIFDKVEHVAIMLPSGNIINNYGAEFSECRQYRYALWRIWDSSKPLIMFIGLNPSTANEYTSDQTIKSICRISKNNDFGGVFMLNCFPYVSTDPKGLKIDVETNIVNNWWLHEISRACKNVVFAWGNFQIVKDHKIDSQLIKMFPGAKALAINKNGSPKHPLYCKKESKLLDFNNITIKNT